MKIRNGFVSNSSSSSFVVFGQSINNLSEADKYIREGKDIIALVEGWENPILIEIKDLEMLSYVMAFQEIKGSIYSIYVAYSWGFEDSYKPIDLSILPKEGTAIIDGGTCDQFSVHNMNDIKEFLEDYWEEIKSRAFSIYTKKMRKEKLNEIVNG